MKNEIPGHGQKHTSVNSVFHADSDSDSFISY